jgi:RNA-binding protein
MKESINTELDLALDFHQLVKIKVGLGDRDQRNELIDTLAEHHKAMLIQRIGSIALLYRKNAKKPSVL